MKTYSGSASWPEPAVSSIKGMAKFTMMKCCFMHEIDAVVLCCRFDDLLPLKPQKQHTEFVFDGLFMLSPVCTPWNLLYN